MMTYVVHLMGNAVHPSETPDVHDGLCSTLDVKSVHLLANAGHPSEAPHKPDRICCTLESKCSRPVGLLMYCT